MKQTIRFQRTARRTGKKGMAKSHGGGNNASFFEPSIQRKCEECEEEDKEKVQKKSDAASTGGGGFFSGYMKGIHAKGKPLGEGPRSFFERRLGGSFGDVRIHSDTEAAMAAKDVRAKAFTWRNHVVLNRAYFDGQDGEGQRLLAHELTHVMQQRRRGDAVQRSPENGPEEETPAPNPGAPTASEREPTGEAAPRTQEKAAEEQEERIMEPESLPDFSTFGKPTVHVDFTKSVTVKGETEATFDNGVGTTRNLKGVPAKKCEGCDASECFTVTGSLVITYSVSTTVTLPDVPEGLTECQEARVRDAIDNKIKPHEGQHVTAFNTYNGTVTLPINYTGCKAGLEAHVQAMHDANAAARESAARAKSAALDPFNVPIDLDCEDPPKK